MGQILNGTNPGDIPFIQVTRVYLALNLKTAKSPLSFRRRYLTARILSSSDLGSAPQRRI